MLHAYIRFTFGALKLHFQFDFICDDSNCDDDDENNNKRCLPLSNTQKSSEYRMCTNAQCTIIPYVQSIYIVHCTYANYVLYMHFSSFFVCFFFLFVFYSLFFLFALVPHSRTFFFCLSSVVFRSSRCAVSRMSAAAAVTACCAVSKCVGQNHRKSFRLVSHFRLVCTVCLNGSAHSLARSLSHSMCVYVPFELLRLGQALFLFHYISAYLVHTAHIMCIALHCIV